MVEQPLTQRCSLMMLTPDETELCFPQLLNTSCKKTKHSYSVAVVVYIIMSIISLLTMTLNLLVIISISHFRMLHTPTNLLLLSLAVSDFFVCILMFLQIVLFDGCWPLGDIMCAVYYVLDYTFTSASIGNMVLISVDRYVAICNPLHYPYKVTHTRIQISVCLCWICSLLFHCVCFMDYLKQPGRYNSCSGECVLVVSYAAGIADAYVSFIGPVVIVVVLYMRVFVVAVSQAHAMRSIRPGALKLSNPVTAKKSEMKAAMVLGAVVVVFLICICPYYGVVLNNQDTFLNASSSALIIWLFYFNSCLNPVIYALFYPWFRKSVKLILTFRILQPNSRDVNVQ